MTDFRRHHWRPVDRNYSVRAKKLQPRISMILAVDNFGNVWFSLAASNSNRGMMCLFMEHLCLKLDREDKHWRSKTCLQWDVRANSCT